MASATLPFPSLVLEHVRAVLRGRFAWTGAAAILGLLTLFAATLGGGPRGLFSFGLVAFAILPTFLAPFVAADIASLRASLVLHRLLTTPQTRGRILLARVAAHGVLASAYIAAVAPTLVVFAIHAPGTTPMAIELAGLGVGILVAGLALGTLCGVAFPGGGPGAAAGVAGGAMVFSLLALFLQGVFLADASAWTLRMLHLSPHLALFNAAGWFLGGPRHILGTPWRSGLAYVALAAGLALLAAYAHERAQDTDGWSHRRARAAVAAGLVLVLALPVFAAAADFTPDAASVRMPRADAVTATLVDVGAPLDRRDEGWLSAGGHLPLGKRVARDLVITLPAEARDVRVRALDGELRMSFPHGGEARAEGREARLAVLVEAIGVSGLVDELNFRRLEVRYHTDAGERVETPRVAAVGSAEGVGSQLGLAMGAPAVACAALATRRASQRRS